MSDWEPTATRSRAAWKDSYGTQQYLAREQSRRERFEQIRREALEDHCHHGRARRLGGNDLQPRAFLECRAGKCPAIYPPMRVILRQWRDTQPDNDPAGGA